MNILIKLLLSLSVFFHHFALPLVELDIRKTTQHGLLLRDTSTDKYYPVQGKILCDTDSRYRELNLPDYEGYSTVYYVDTKDGTLMIPSARVEFSYDNGKKIVKLADNFCLNYNDKTLVLEFKDNPRNTDEKKYDIKKITKNEENEEVEEEINKENQEKFIRNSWYPAILNFRNNTSYEMKVYFKRELNIVPAGKVFTAYLSHRNEIADLKVHYAYGMMSNGYIYNSWQLVADIKQTLSNFDKSFEKKVLHSFNIDINQSGYYTYAYTPKVGVAQSFEIPEIIAEDLDKLFLTYNNANLVHLKAVLDALKRRPAFTKDDKGLIHDYGIIQFAESLCLDCEVANFLKDIRQYIHDDHFYLKPLIYPAILTISNPRNNDLFIHFRGIKYEVKGNDASAPIELYIQNEGELRDLIFDYTTGGVPYKKTHSDFTEAIKLLDAKHCADEFNLCKIEIFIGPKPNYKVQAKYISYININSSAEAAQKTAAKIARKKKNKSLDKEDPDDYFQLGGLTKYDLMSCVHTYATADKIEDIQAAFIKLGDDKGPLFDFATGLKAAGNSGLLYNFANAAWQTKEEVKTFNILVVGDQGKFDMPALAVADGLRQVSIARPPHLFLSSGDNVYPQGPAHSDTNKNWAVILKKYSVDLYNRLFQLYAVPGYFTLGNHDEGKTSVFDEYYRTKASINSAGRILAQVEFTNSEYNVFPEHLKTNKKPWNMPAAYYSFEQEERGIKIFVAVIDTNYFPHSLEQKDYAQLDWLQKNLVSDGAKAADYKFVVGHHGFSSAKHGNKRHLPIVDWLNWKRIEYEENKEVVHMENIRTALMPPLCNHQVDFYIVGHDHVLEIDKLPCESSKHQVLQILSGAAAKADGHGLKKEWLKDTTVWWNGAHVYEKNMRRDLDDIHAEAKRDLYGFFTLHLYSKNKGFKAYDLRAYEVGDNDRLDLIYDHYENEEHLAF